MNMQFKKTEEINLLEKEIDGLKKELISKRELLSNINQCEFEKQNNLIKEKTKIKWYDEIYVYMGIHYSIATGKFVPFGYEKKDKDKILINFYSLNHCEIINR